MPLFDIGSAKEDIKLQLLYYLTSDIGIYLIRKVDDNVKYCQLLSLIPNNC